MNWYKTSQQTSFDFWNEDKRDQFVDTRPESLRPTPEMHEDWNFEEAVEECKSQAELLNILKFYADSYDIITFPNKVRIVQVIIGNDLKIIDGSDGYFEVKDPKEWIWDIGNSGRADE